MGYITDFYLDIKNIESELSNKGIKNKLKELDASFIEVKKYTSYYHNEITGKMHEEKKEIVYIHYECRAKWYDHEKELKNITKEIPGVLIKLYGIGEEPLDIWRKYFYNGKMQLAKAKINFDDFDVDKLE